MFRSEPMSLCQLLIPFEAIYTTIAELGESGCMQFTDLNTNLHITQRSFFNEVLRCDELQRRLNYIAQQITKAELQLPEAPEDDDDGYNEPAAPNARQINEMEAQLEQVELELQELSRNGADIKRNYQELNEHKTVLEQLENFFVERASLNEVEKYLYYVTGVMPLEHYFSLERMIWRVTMGNVFFRRTDVMEEISDNNKQSNPRAVFVAFFHGEQLKERVFKICSGYHVVNHPCPLDANERAQLLTEIKVRMADMQLVLSQTDDHRNGVLRRAALYMHNWRTQLIKMQSIYHTMNNFSMDVSKKCLVGEGWTPSSDLEQLKAALQRGTQKAESSTPTIFQVVQPSVEQVAPTYNRTNRFTQGFQNITDAYGVANYGEVNPSLYSLITFPFLFGCMYGDIGHGFILLLFATWMVWNERKLAKIKEEIFSIFFSGRYIILLMGLFSIYAGLIYNDVFSKSINLFGSGWLIQYNTSTVLGNTELQLSPATKEHTYAMGLDPVWQFAENQIVFLNSYKMKLSIILGVAHMLLGICMSVVNFVHLKKKLHILFDFVPQLIFLLFLFGYLVFMMFFKWIKYTDKSDELALKPGCAPSILIIFINMVLFGHTAPLPGCDEHMFKGQYELQIVLLVMALLCIPWMLFARPLYIRHQRRHGTVSSDEPFGEILIAQTIHTIEFVLSTVSHTASYLRIWALSLAHSQLSDVLWKKMLNFGFILPLGYFNVIAIFILFPVWAVLTLGILVVIEGLSAFLHTMRLHWVEFMSKFYKGEGYIYQPFAFKVLLQTKVE